MPYEQMKLSTDKPVLSWANHDLGSAEIQMAKNIALSHKALVQINFS